MESLINILKILKKNCLNSFNYVIRSKINKAFSLKNITRRSTGH